MRSINEREKALNLFFHDGKGYKTIAREIGVPLNTVKSWVRRYRIELLIIMTINELGALFVFIGFWLHMACDII